MRASATCRTLCDPVVKGLRCVVARAGAHHYKAAADTDPDPRAEATHLSAGTLLDEIRKACGRSGATSPASRRRLEQLVAREGATEDLLRTLREGSLADAHLAAAALQHAQSPLVRRGLRRDAAKASGERRSAYLTALSMEEVQDVLSLSGRELGLELLYELGLIAVNDPGAFVELACRGVARIDEPLVDLFERVRARYRVPTASIYAPILERPLTRRARARVVALLGLEASDRARTLLEKEATRAQGSAALDVRRERLRHATRTLSGEAKAPLREGAALAGPMTGEAGWALELVEPIGRGELLLLCVLVRGLASAQVVVSTEEGALDAIERTERGRKGFVRISRAQARALLETTGARSRVPLAPVLERLADVEPAAVLPVPAGRVSDEAAHGLVLSALWSQWMPFETVVAMAPVRADGQALATAALRLRGFGARLALGLRHQAFLMHVKGDPLAPAVAAEAIEVARRRPGAVTVALANLAIARAAGLK